VALVCCNGWLASAALAEERILELQRKSRLSLRRQSFRYLRREVSCDPIGSLFKVNSEVAVAVVAARAV